MGWGGQSQEAGDPGFLEGMGGGVGRARGESIPGSPGRKLGCKAKLAGCSPGRGGQDGERMSWAVTVFKCVLLPGPHLQQAPALTSL